MKITCSLPNHLKAFVQPTPSSVMKLLAAWDGLTVESQIKILETLQASSLPEYLFDKVREKAFQSSNAYVRYLAVKELHFRDDDSLDKKELQHSIEQDPSPLVRYSRPKSRKWKGFFDMPHEARLARIRATPLLLYRGEEFASLIFHAIDNHLKDGKVSETEIFEILLEYVNNPSFKEEYFVDREDRYLHYGYNGYAEYLAGKDIEALWQLVPKLPEEISHVLIEHLPEEAGLSSGITSNVLEALTPSQLCTLLYRKDIGLEDFRKRLFLTPLAQVPEPPEPFDLEMVRSAASCFNFDLEHQEFAEILKRPEEEKLALLQELGSHADDLKLVFYDAIHDVLASMETAASGARENACYASDKLEQKRNELRHWKRREQLRELRLYHLAREAVPWQSGQEGHAPSGELKFLAETIIAGDTWGTFMSFSKAWAKKDWRSHDRLERNLPKVYMDYEDDLQIKDDIFTIYEEQSPDVAHRIEEKISEILTILFADPQDPHKGLTNAIAKLTSYLMTFQETTRFKINRLESQIEVLLAESKIILILFFLIMAWLSYNLIKWLA